MLIFSRKEDGEMNPIQSAVQDVTIGVENSYANLTVFPLLGETIREPRYLTLGEALEKGLILIREVGRHGSVPDLEVENRADRPVLLLDGEELVGAKQNRVLNLTVLVPAGKTISIPVSCVEMGRWHRVSPSFTDSDSAQFAGGRAAKARTVTQSLAMTGEPTSDQSQVWNEIAAKMGRMGTRSPTSAMRSLYEGHRVTLGDYLSHFPMERNQLGGCFAVGPRVLGLELFDSPTSFRRLFPKILRSYAIEAIEIRPKEFSAPGREAAEAFRHAVARAGVGRYPAVGLGEALRITEPGLAGGGLAWEERLVHAVAFAV
jgi:hypothetical protein